MSEGRMLDKNEIVQHPVTIKPVIYRMRPLHTALSTVTICQHVKNTGSHVVQQISTSATRKKNVFRFERKYLRYVHFVFAILTKRV